MILESTRRHIYSLTKTGTRSSEKNPRIGVKPNIGAPSFNLAQVLGKFPQKKIVFEELILKKKRIDIKSYANGQWILFFFFFWEFNYFFLP